MTTAAAPKNDADTPFVAIRTKPPSPKRLSRKVLLAGALAMGAVIVFALTIGLSDRPGRVHEADGAVTASGGPPQSILQASEQYDAGAMGGVRLQGLPDTTAQITPPQDPAWASQPARPSVASNSARTVDPELAAHNAPILFTNEAGARASASAPSAAASGAHASFMGQQGGAEARLEARLMPPRSAFEILAGSVIPAALATELNSDLPGRIIAQVTEPIYDSVTGDHLLIPQGSRLIGSYDNATTYGDRRLLLVWNRLILPDGWSINLEGMEGTDPAGASGVRDSTDNHLGQLATAIALSAVMSVVADNSQDDNKQGFTQSVGDAAAHQAASTGGHIVDRELSVHPTLRVRVGAPVRVLVTRDIRLRPYRGVR